MRDTPLCLGRGGYTQYGVCFGGGGPILDNSIVNTNVLAPEPVTSSVSRIGLPHYYAQYRQNSGRNGIYAPSGLTKSR